MVRTFYLWAASLAVVGVAGCSRQVPKPAAAGAAAPPPVPVLLGEAVKRTMPILIPGLGTVESKNSSVITSRVGGQLKQIHFVEGQYVEKDALLFTIDPESFEERLHQAEGAVARDEAKQKFQKSEAARYAALKQTGMTAEADLERTLAEVASLAATILADEAAVREARLNLSYCTIRAPVGGHVGMYGLHEGGIVEENKTLLAVVNQIKPVYVAFSVPEKYLPEVMRCQGQGPLTVYAYPPGEEARQHEGKLIFINNTIDTDSGLIMMRAEFPNTDERLWPGRFVHAVLKLGEKPDAVLVPEAAVQSNLKGAYLFVVDAELKTAPRSVEVGTTLAGMTEILKGVAAGEKVVTDGQNKLKRGFTVKVKGTAAQEPGAPPAAPPAAAGPKLATPQGQR